jgi:hypothetical protein
MSEITLGELDGAAAFAALGGKLTGTELLDQVRAKLKRYVVFPQGEAADAVTLWIAATHAQQSWQHAPRLAVVSPEKRCGKSRLLDLLDALCCNPLMSANISVAALVHSISAADPPTLLVDEADTKFGPKSAADNEPLRGILNAGHQRNRPYVRWDVAARDREECPTFAMAALASILDLPDTIMDRAVVLRMRRRAPGESVRPYRTRTDEAPLKGLGAKLGEWLMPHRDDLAKSYPEMPVEDRAADTWEPLVAVADLAGGHWPATARAACIALTSETAETGVTTGIRLLADIKMVFGDSEKMHTESLIGGLCKLEESPWADWKGKNVTPRNLADLLRPYGVRSGQVWADGKNGRGYSRDDLHDAWERYLPPRQEGGARSVRSVRPQVKGTPNLTPNTCEVLDVRDDPPVTSTLTDLTDLTDTPSPRGGTASASRSAITVEATRPEAKCEKCGALLSAEWVAAGRRYHGYCEPAVAS